MRRTDRGMILHHFCIALANDCLSACPPLRSTVRLAGSIGVPGGAAAMLVVWDPVEMGT